MAPRREVIVPSVRALGVASSFGQAVSTVVRGGDFLFVCGLSAVDPRSGERVRGTTASETRQILINLKQLLEAAGSSLDKVVKVNVLLHSMLEAPNMTRSMPASFPTRRPPARSVAHAFPTARK